MGALVEETSDGMVIDGGRPLKGTKLDSHGDHRIAMAFAIAGLFAEGETIIENSSCIAISYPNFKEHLDELLSMNRGSEEQPIPVIKSLNIRNDKD
jgi:3-phosphoshikimate 1-carboxyvinyltransferase